jgi:hypothetical protein
MTKEWTTYAQLTTSTNPLNSEEEQEYVGMSDEDEIERAKEYYRDGEGVGEVLVEIPADEETLKRELQDLGLVEDG